MRLPFFLALILTFPTNLVFANSKAKIVCVKTSLEELRQSTTKSSLCRLSDRSSVESIQAMNKGLSEVPKPMSYKRPGDDFHSFPLPTNKNYLRFRIPLNAPKVLVTGLSRLDHSNSITWLFSSSAVKTAASRLESDNSLINGYLIQYSHHNEVAMDCGIELLCRIESLE
ncbi:MAG: hypothetical protein AB8E15_06360 [Bdellovibrionales bacterium]